MHQFDGFLAQGVDRGTEKKRWASTWRAGLYPFSNFETSAVGDAAAAVTAVRLRHGRRVSERERERRPGEAATVSSTTSGSRWENVFSSSDRAARAAHLERTHVDTLEAVQRLLTRCLCGGGCQHEVTRRGRVGCDYIRGWLEFCLSAYAELLAARPEHSFAAEPR